jgi:phosphate transport system substrate-binding protein
MYIGVLCNGLGVSGILAQTAPDNGATGQTAPHDSVTLTTPENSLQITGRLISHDGAYARIQTDAGPVTIAMEGGACKGVGCPGPENAAIALRIVGAPEIARVLMPALIQRYALSARFRLERHETGADKTEFRLFRPDASLTIELEQMPVAQALAAQREQRADLVLALNAPPETAPRQIRVLALDGLVPVVARDNPLTRLTMVQLHGILSGRLTDWADLGFAEGGAISVLSVSQGAPPGLLPQTTAPAPLEDPQASSLLAEQVASLRGGFALIRESRLRLARPLALDGGCSRPIAATPLRLKAEDYPLSAPLLLILPRGRLPESALGLLDFLASPTAQLVVRRAGFTDQEPERIGIDAQGQRLANAVRSAGRSGTASLEDLQELVDALSGAERLTTTFRFRDGGSNLDAQSVGNVARLARIIDSGQLNGRRVIFAGFSDGTGATAANEALSLARAKAVRTAVQTVLTELRGGLSPIPLEAQGYGEALPMGCDETAWGRQVNRRVEVWLR